MPILAISILISSISILFLSYLVGITVLTDKNHLRFYDGSAGDFLCDRSIYGIWNWAHLAILAMPSINIPVMIIIILVGTFRNRKKEARNG
jgi:hypothetical protein